MIIDAHCHLAPPDSPGAPSLKDVDGFLERKAQDGIDRAVIVHGIVRLPGVGGLLDRLKRWNEFNLGVREQYPDRVSVMVGVDAFEGGENLEEARRCVAAGSCGFSVSAIVDGHRLDDERAEDFWCLAEELDVPVLIHPTVSPFAVGDPRLEEFGNRAVEVGLSLAAAIFGGVLDRHPSLRLIAGAGVAGSPLWRAGSMPATGFRHSRARRWLNRPEVLHLRAQQRRPGRSRSRRRHQVRTCAGSMSTR